MCNDHQIRVVIADDHAVIREGIVAMLARDPGISVVAEAQDGVHAVTQYRRHRPDVALIDIAMPRMNGTEATRAICSEFHDARILLLTLSEAEEDVYQGIRAGAKAYLPKTIECSALIHAIREVFAGRAVIPQHAAAALAERSRARALTARELEILRHVSEGKTNAEIANELFIAEATTRTHINHILSKLGARDRTQAVTTAIKRGLLRV